MTLSFRTESIALAPSQVDVLAHHDLYDQPESGCTLRIGTAIVHLTGEDTIKLGTFLAGGHVALNASA